MRFFVGTSGWLYDWNLGGDFRWFVENSGLNAVELNASFYRFPFPNQVIGWAKRGKHLRWSIKVNRLITHVFKFGERALESWEKFRKLFEPLEEAIDFYLFQLPPGYGPKNSPVLERFIRRVNLGERFALEVRSPEWYDKKWVNWAKELGVTWVSVDCPDFPNDVYATSDLIYERMHGRSAWYCHCYSDEELQEILQKIVAAGGKAAYIFFNNDHDMLNNARKMLELTKRLV
jgi:uncharacterized protein YecE (DUF72 family)